MKILFYGALSIGLIALTFYIWDKLVERSKKRNSAKRKSIADRDEEIESKILAFLQNEKGDYSLAHMRRIFQPDEIENLLSREDILSFFLQFGSLGDIIELMEKTRIKKHSPLTRKMLLNSLVRGEDFFHALVSSYGQKEADKLLVDSIHYQSYRGDEDSLLLSVDRAMSGHQGGHGDRYAASLLWFSIHSGNPRIVEEVLRLGNTAKKFDEKYTGESEIELVCKIGDERTIDLVFKAGLPRKDLRNNETYFEKLLTRDFSGDFLLKYATMLASDGLRFDATRFQSTLKEKGIYAQILELFPLRPEDPMISGIAHQLAKTSTEKEPSQFISFAPYFDDLIGYEKFREKFEFEISNWRNKPLRTRMKLFWGPASIGKTELCMRLSGLKNGYIKPREFHEVHYITPSNLGALAEVFKSSEGNLILVDDFHTVADRELSVNYHPQLHKDFLVQLKTAVSVTNHYWVFLVTRKPAKDVLESDVLRMFGEDLAGYVDHEDWALPKWGIWELAKFAGAHQEMGKLFDEEGLANIVSRIHAKGMGPKELNRIVNFAHSMGANDKLNLKQVSLLLEKIGA